jgi:hypothetical protein
VIYEVTAAVIMEFKRRAHSSYLQALSDNLEKVKESCEGFPVVDPPVRLVLLLFSTICLRVSIFSVKTDNRRTEGMPYQR